MRVFLTGGTGFIGGEVARALRARGDEVVALVRSPEKAGRLKSEGAEIVAGGLGDREAITRGMAGCDAVVHVAAIYEVGIPESDHPAMYAANVTGTETVLAAALEANVGKVVYVSTVGAFGNTHGEVVDESYEHPGGSYCSYYEETKVEAHRVARRMTGEGLPCVIVQPGGVYGPDDHSALGDMITRFCDGKLPAMAFPELGVNLAHRDDVAAGILLALDRGEPGEAYVLGGTITTMAGVIETLASLVGRKPPRFTMPAVAIRAIAPLGRFVGPALGFPPNIRELVSSADGVTYWATDAKARRELGYEPRELEQGMHDLLAAEGRLPA